MKLSEVDVMKDAENALTSGSSIGKLISNGKTSNQISPNPCFFNNLLISSDEKNKKYELVREMPYTTFYNLSCLLSSLNDAHIESITKLQKLENAHFMMTKLNDWIGDNSVK